jgi:hypothetical protein
MSLREGDRLPDEECWIRVLTNTDHRTKDGTVHQQAFKGKTAILACVGKAYSHEVSGRAASEAVDIGAEAEAVIQRIRDKFADAGMALPSKIQFAGVACARAASLRRASSEFQSDTVFTPKPDDPAHSDFVTIGTTDGDIDRIRACLIQRLKVVPAADLGSLATTCT